MSRLAPGLTVPRHRGSMKGMPPVLRTLAAVLAVAALVAALPAPCGCAPEPTRESGHACCASRAGVSLDDHACCDDAGHLDEAVPPSATPLVGATEEAGPAFSAPAPAARPPARRAVPAAPSPPPAVLRI
jgi:hypothetical protein